MPQWVMKGTNTMLAPGDAPPGAIGGNTTPHKVLRGVLQQGDQAPARDVAPIPRPGHNTPSLGGTTPSTGSSGAWALAHPYSTPF